MTALDFLSGVDSGIYTLEPFTAADLGRCCKLIKIYRDLHLGLADAAILATAQRLGMFRVLTKVG